MIVDTNVVIDLLEGNVSPEFADVIAQLQAERGAFVNEIVFAEVSARFDSVGEVLDILEELGLRLVRLSLDDCHRAGAAFNLYRREGLSRTSILPDFLIGAQAESQGWPILTRDRKGFARYFPKVDLIDPYEGLE